MENAKNVQEEGEGWSLQLFKRVSEDRHRAKIEKKMGQIGDISRRRRKR